MGVPREEVDRTRAKSGVTRAPWRRPDSDLFQAFGHQGEASSKQDGAQSSGGAVPVQWRRRTNVAANIAQSAAATIAMKTKRGFVKARMPAPNAAAAMASAATPVGRLAAKMRMLHPARPAPWNDRPIGRRRPIVAAVKAKI